MLAKWTEVLPVFVVRWMANRWCEHSRMYLVGNTTRDFIEARPDVWFAGRIEKHSS